MQYQLLQPPPGPCYAAHVLEIACSPFDSPLQECTMRCACFALLLCLLAPPLASAEVTALSILQREPFAGGKSFGDVGPYEKIVGIVRFAIDPRDKHNLPIVDLDFAPRNPQGKVEFEADVVILAPKDRSKSHT